MAKEEIQEGAKLSTFEDLRDTADTIRTLSETTDEHDAIILYGIAEVMQTLAYEWEILRGQNALPQVSGKTSFLHPAASRKSLGELCTERDPKFSDLLVHNRTITLTRYTNYDSAAENDELLLSRESLGRLLTVIGAQSIEEIEAQMQTERIENREEARIPLWHQGPELVCVRVLKSTGETAESYINLHFPEVAIQKVFNWDSDLETSAGGTLTTMSPSEVEI